MDRNPLFSVPGLGGYLGAQQFDRQNQMGQLQQINSLVALQRVMQEQAAREQAQQQQQAYRQAISALPPDAGADQLLQTARPYVGPDTLVRGLQDAENRKAQAEATRAANQERIAAAAAAQQERIAAQMEMARQRMEDQKLSRAEQNQARMDMMRLAASLRPAPQEQMLPVQQPDGSIIYTPRSQAAGQRVGGRVTDQNIQKQVQALGTALEKANVNESSAVLRDVEERLNKVPNLPEFLAGPKSAVPDIAVGMVADNADDIRTGRQAFQKLFNITLKDRSGAAVTIPEFNRLKAEFATGVWKTPEQVKAGVAQARNIIQKHYQGIAASYGKNVLDAYNENLRGVGASPIVETGGAPAASPDEPPPGAVRRKQ